MCPINTRSYRWVPVPVRFSWVPWGLLVCLGRERSMIFYYHVLNSNFENKVQNCFAGKLCMPNS